LPASDGSAGAGLALGAPAVAFVAGASSMVSFIIAAALASVALPAAVSFDVPCVLLCVCFYRV
jgi:hypothetical protein